MNLFVSLLRSGVAFKDLIIIACDHLCSFPSASTFSIRSGDKIRAAEIRVIFSSDCGSLTEDIFFIFFEDSLLSLYLHYLAI